MPWVTTRGPGLPIAPSNAELQAGSGSCSVSGVVSSPDVQTQSPSAPKWHHTLILFQLIITSPDPRASFRRGGSADPTVRFADVLRPLECWPGVLQHVLLCRQIFPTLFQTRQTSLCLNETSYFTPDITAPPWCPVLSAHAKLHFLCDGNQTPLGATANIPRW